jgi:hypothetical protein
LDLFSTWCHNRPNSEKLFIHLMFAEIPPTFPCGTVYNDRVVSQFEEIRNRDPTTYRRIEAIWCDFLRILLTH